MVEYQVLEMPKVKEVYTTYEYLESSSGEIFYITNGKLAKTDSRESFEKIQREKTIQERVYYTMRNTYFEFSYKGIRYGFPMMNREDILNKIKEIQDLDLMVELLKKYTNELSQLETLIESIKKGGN